MCVSSPRVRFIKLSAANKERRSSAGDIESNEDKDSTIRRLNREQQ